MNSRLKKSQPSNEGVLVARLIPFFEAGETDVKIERPLLR
jgi:hypothetical protein